ncbi:hypothetical protein LB464_23085, partial [Escherichia coli]|uniref:hypothetical protein n=1 Tax=Escherichia coli TaxID=562 RepID=UPI0022705105
MQKTLKAGSRITLRDQLQLMMQIELLNVVFMMNTISIKGGFAPIFPDICYHLTHYKPAAADIPVASDNPA